MSIRPFLKMQLYPFRIFTRWNGPQDVHCSLPTRKSRVQPSDDVPLPEPLATTSVEAKHDWRLRSTAMPCWPMSLLDKPNEVAAFFGTTEMGYEAEITTAYRSAFGSRHTRKQQYIYNFM